MKKIVSYGLLSLLFLGTAGCSVINCEHNYKEVSKENPTVEKEGSIKYECDKCWNSYSNPIPKLDNVNYVVTHTEESCENEGYDQYYSEQYGTYKVKTADMLYHTSYGGLCNLCDNNINNFHFYEEDIVKVATNGGYPRLYVLNDGTWLCGFDSGGQIKIVRSNDEGQNWGDYVTASVHDAYSCANVAFYQYENGDILCAYRAIGNSSDPYGRYIQCTISHDNGYTWEYHSTIENNYELGFSKEAVDAAVASEPRLGFFEPHFGVINGKVTVMYADDFTTMLENVRGSQILNYETQYIVARELVENTWSDRKIILDGTIMKTVSGITDYSRDGMPVFDQMSDGTYVLAVEGTYRRVASRGNNPFIILLSYSKDGVNWSIPEEVYVPKGSGTKASAPYICVTSDDRLVISFQTDEDSAAAGKGYGDGVSIMKTIISDGTPVEQLTKENFYEAQNVFSTPAGRVSSWNGMLMKDDVLYCVTGSNYPASGIYMNSSPVPVQNPIGSPSNEVETTGITVRNGNISRLENGWLRAKDTNTLATFDDKEVLNGSISVNMIPMYENDSGLIFRVTSGANKYWESAGNSYYVLLINYLGDLLLGKIDGNGGWSLLENNTELMEDFSRGNLYNLKVELDGPVISCYVNDELYIEYEDSSPLAGTGVGVRSSAKGVLFNDLVVAQ